MFAFSMAVTLNEENSTAARDAGGLQMKEPERLTGGRARGRTRVAG